MKKIARSETLVDGPANFPASSRILPPTTADFRASGPHGIEEPCALGPFRRKAEASRRTSATRAV